MTLYIRYDNTALQDGIGAQALRILGVYSISKAFKLRYIHSQILSAVEEFSHSRDNRSLSETLAKFNALFMFPQDSIPLKFQREIVVRDLNLRYLLKLMLRYRFSRNDILLTTLLPFQVTDRVSFIYRFGVRRARKNLRSQIATVDAGSKNFVVVHIRFGYGWMYGEQTHLSRRKFLTPAFYSELIEEACKKFSIPKDVPILVHTDLSRDDKIWKPNDVETLQGFRELSRNPNAEHILLKGRDLSRELSCPTGYQIDFRYCADTYETFIQMCTADLLIMGTSTFSYLAGLINSKKVIWNSAHDHKKMPRWYSEDDFDLNIPSSSIVHLTATNK